MGLSQTPVFFEGLESFDKLWVVSQLWVHNFNILLVPVQEEISQSGEAFLYLIAQLPHSETLIGTHLPANIVSDDQHRDVKVVSALAKVIRHAVDLTNLL